MSRLEEFQKFREEINQEIEKIDNQTIKRFFALDNQVYQEGALPAKTKELLGLVGSMVLRCDDCITYHLWQSQKAGVNKKEVEEAMAVALVVGGSIVIPHMRRAVEIIREMEWPE